MATETKLTDVKLLFERLTGASETLPLAQVPCPAPKTAGVYVLIERKTPCLCGPDREFARAVTSAQETIGKEWKSRIYDRADRRA